jgi:PKD repeat protein
MRLRYAVWTRVATVLGVAAGGAVTALPGCSCDGGSVSGDAGSGGDGDNREDAAGEPDAAVPLIWVDFSLSGCAPAANAMLAGGPDAEVCQGTAPLRLSFIPIAPAPVDQYEWTFGDGSEPDRRSAPDHVYTTPGVYDVSVAAQGPGGTAAVTKAALVEVLPGAIGAACSDDSQCGSGLCVCGAEPCEELASGFCSAPCSAANPCSDGVCADLAPGTPPEPEAWQAELCLRDCGADGACPDGQVCRELRSGDAAGWIAACFEPGHLGDIGDSCADQNGALQDSLCASGQCIDQGLRGTCSAPCASQDCPASAACAAFNQAPTGPFCLARCDADTACAGDPWLACEAAGGAGARGFTVEEESSPDGYCAPEACDGPDECPLGQCTGGFCGP